MSNTAAADKEFRKVDVDQYDEDNFQDEKVETVDFDSSSVQTLLNKSEYTSALKIIVNSPALLGSSKDAKMKLTDTFVRMYHTIKSTEIPKIIDELNPEEQTNLMKVIYCTFFCQPKADFSLLHIWHEKVFFI